MDAYRQKKSHDDVIFFTAKDGAGQTRPNRASPVAVKITGNYRVLSANGGTGGLGGSLWVYLRGLEPYRASLRRVVPPNADKWP